MCVSTSVGKFDEPYYFVPYPLFTGEDVIVKVIHFYLELILNALISSRRLFSLLVAYGTPIVK